MLRVGGGYCIGTPNKARWVGYLGSIGVPLRTKLAWNVADWRARLGGRFTNEAGAHAGFSSHELRAELTASFGDASEISMDYYRAVYPDRRSQLDTLQRIGLAKFLLPSVYFFGLNVRLGA